MSCCWMFDEVSFMCMEYYKVSGCKYTTFHFGSVEYYPWTLQSSILASPECYSGAFLSSSILIIHDLMITWYDPQRFGRLFWMRFVLKDLEHVFFLALSLLEIGLECLWCGGREHRPSELHLARFTWTFRPRVCNRITWMWGECLKISKPMIPFKRESIGKGSFFAKAA